MAGVRSMLARVQRLEAARGPLSPFIIAYGSLEAWEANTAEQVAAGVIDGRDMEDVCMAVRRWHNDGLFG